MKMERTILNSLRVLFALIFLGMLSVIIIATIDQNIFEAVGNMWPNWWFKATLTDLYFGFLTFFVWVAYKAIHLELFKLKEGDTLETLLTRRHG